MKRRLLGKNAHSESRDKSLGTDLSGQDLSKLNKLSADEIDRIFSEVGRLLRQGLSSAARELLETTIRSYDHSADVLANLNRLLSFTLETLGSYRDALIPLKPYEEEELLDTLTPDVAIRVQTQLAISYNNLTDHPKAVTLLKTIREQATENKLEHLYGSIEIALTRVYRRLNEYVISRDHADLALGHLREMGDWLGMAETYREIAMTLQSEGNSEKALVYFQLAIQIVGSNQAPFQLGRLYSDMSGAYWFLRRPYDGIECLEKSIDFFDRTEHVLNSVIAYNNLGINYELVGEWAKAEQMIKRALELAVKSNHASVAGILDSLGELSMLRGEFEVAESYLNQAISFAIEKKREYYAAQSMQNLARCFMLQGRFDEAITKANETIEKCHEIKNLQYELQALLVLAESYLNIDEIQAYEDALAEIAGHSPDSDYFVLGQIQRIRGHHSLRENDREMALHHFKKSLTIFEAAHDRYNIGIAHFLIGEHSFDEENGQAIKHLTTAADIFRKLGLSDRVAASKQLIQDISEPIKQQVRDDEKKRSNSVVSQLLMVRLAEATATRELLFRELMAVLQQESKAKKIIIAQQQDGHEIQPFITHGYSPEDSGSLIRKFDDELQLGNEKAFASSKNLAFFPLKSANAAPAYLIIQPQNAAFLNDDSPLQPLLKVVELGMDVVALREKDKTQPGDELNRPSVSNDIMPGFIHSSPAMTALVDEVYKIRSSDVTVLVTGESGTGKELVARAIHTISTRKDKVFVPFNCTAVPKELAEGHLFGYRKGAFTGAVADSPGIIRAADGGSLFLDEIGDLPIDVQPKLLRFLQEGEVQPIGEKTPVKVDVRVIAATNMPLEDKVLDGSFREDLYYRLNVIRLRVPPLRERRGEIPPIINYYLNHYSSRFSKKNLTITPQTIDLLMVVTWDGNVRQLCNEIQRIVARAVDNEIITPSHISPELRRGLEPIPTFKESKNVKPITSYESSFSMYDEKELTGTLENAVSELEISMIRSSLTRHNWNISRVASELGLTRRGLYLKLSRYGIEKAG